MALRIWKNHYSLCGAIIFCMTVLAITGCGAIPQAEQQQSLAAVTVSSTAAGYEAIPQAEQQQSLAAVTISSTTMHQERPTLSPEPSSEPTLPLKETFPSNTTESSQPEPNPKLKLAMAANKDVIGWITIPNTIIDYPVVQGEDNKYYLNHNANRQKSVSGSIFMDYRADSEKLTGNVVLYGHHMKNESMFAALMGYKELTFFQEHPVIEYFTLSGRTRWQIFSAYVTDTKFYYIETNFTRETFRDFLSVINRKSKFQTEIPLNEMDAVLTLSTCTYEFDDARFVVHARRLSD